MGGGVKSQILTVMFLDLANYTRATSELSQHQLNLLHETFDNLVLPTIADFSGNVVKKIGDAFLVTFDSPSVAVECSKELQNDFAQFRKENKTAPIHIRIALNLGEVLLRNGDVYGTAVNTAARIEGITKADHIVMGESVLSAMNGNAMPTIFIGEKKLKGLNRPIRLYKVKTKEDIIIASRKKRERQIEKFKRKVFKTVKIFLAFVLFFLLAFIVWFVVFYF
ncbi:MAG: adenylate/guanylate cyclase domain-containing protein [Nanoarchaeota archaeon]